MTGHDYTNYTFDAMGTVCQVQYQASSHAASNAFKTAVSTWVSTFEQTFSRFIPASIVSRLNESAGVHPVDIDAEAESLFALCDWFHWSTRGAFDPSILPVLALWDYHVPHSELPPPGAVSDALKRCGWKSLQRQNGQAFLPEKGMGIDVGGIGKEYAVDRVFEMAGDYGIRNILVNFGKDLRVQGAPPEGGPWRIGLEDPRDTRQCWGGVALQNRAVTTSGNYLRKVTIGSDSYGHIVDPRTGYPVNHGCLSVSVVACTCTEAGILSTTAFIMGETEGLPFLDSYYQAEGCMNTLNGTYYTRRFNEYLIRN